MVTHADLLVPFQRGAIVSRFPSPNRGPANPLQISNGPNLKKSSSKHLKRQAKPEAVGDDLEVDFWDFKDESELETQELRTVASRRRRTCGRMEIWSGSGEI